jgi:hypothetical protein
MTDIPRSTMVTGVSSIVPCPPTEPVTLDAIRKIVREEVRANAALEAAARQALEALEKGATVSAAITLRAALKEKA